MKALRAAYTSVALALALSGCVTMDTVKPTVEAWESVRQAPALPVIRNITNFSDGLRCMDKLLAEHGAKLSLMVEDIGDKTTKSPAGTTDMFIGSLSTMSRRSQAIRAVAFSRIDTSNTNDFIVRSDSKGPFKPSNMPQYAVRGSVSQFDDNAARATQDAGVSLGPFGKIGAAIGIGKSSSVSEVALDLQMIRSSDFSIVAGVSSANKAAILQDGQGRDGDVSVSKLGVNYQTSVAKSDGKSVALRNLVDLAAIELVGRGTKTAYWTCLGISLKHPDVQGEISDWFEGMTSTEKLLFFVREFRTLQLFAEGQAIDPDLLKLAFAAYAEALDVSRRDAISLELFQKHFAADRDVIGPKTLALFEKAKSQPIELLMELLPKAPGGAVRVVLTPAQAAYVYCFSQDEATRQVHAIFPLAGRPSQRLESGKPVPLGELMRQAWVPSARAQTLSCFTSRADRSAQIAAWLRSAGGTPIRGLDSLGPIREQLAELGFPPGHASVRLGGGRPMASLP